MDISMLNGSVPDAIERIIVNKGMKKCVVATRANMTPQAFNDILNGRRLLKAHDIVLIAKALEVTPNELFETA